MKRFLCLLLAITLLSNLTTYAKGEYKYELHFFDELTGDVFFDDNYIYHINQDNILTVIKPSVGIIIDESLGYSLINPDNKRFLFTDGVLWVRKGKKIGAIDQYGNVTVDFIYDDVKHISEGIFVCKKENSYGCVDIKGNLIADFIYSDIGLFKNGIANAVLNENNVILKNNGQIDTRYDQLPYGFISEFRNGFAFVRDEPVYSKWCRSLPTAAAITEYAIMNEIAFRGMPADPTPDEYNDAIGFVKSGYSFIDEQGKVIIDGLEADLRYWDGIYFKPSYFAVGGVAKVLKNEKPYIIDREGNVICDYVTDFLGASAWIGKKDNEYVSVSYITGDVKILGKYDSITLDTTTSTFVKVKKDNNFGVIDNNGNIILPCEFDDISIYDDYGFLLTKNGSVNKLYSVKNNAFLPVDFHEFDFTKINDKLMIFVKKSGKWRIINSDTFLISEAEYDKVYNYSNINIVVGNGDKMGIIDSNFNTVVPVAYDNAMYNGGQYALVMNDNEYSIYDIHSGEMKYIGFNNNYSDATLGNYIKVYSKDFKTKELFDWQGNKVFSANCSYLGYTYEINVEDGEDVFKYSVIDKNPTGEFVETQYYMDSDLKLIYYIKNDQVFDAQNNKLFDNGRLFGYSHTKFKGIYMPSNVPENLMAVYERPFPKKEQKGKYICLMLNNPLINLNGKIELLEKDNWFMQPAVENSSVLVPIQGILESLGLSVFWFERSQTIICKNGNKTVKLTIDKPEMLVNGEKYVLDSVPKLIGGRAFFPLRAVSEALGAHVDWDENNQLITIAF